jgi:hypothetical protein
MGMSPKAFLFGKCGQRGKSIPPWALSLAWGAEASHRNLETEWMPCVSPFKVQDDQFVMEDVVRPNPGNFSGFI